MTGAVVGVTEGGPDPTRRDRAGRHACCCAAHPAGYLCTRPAHTRGRHIASGAGVVRATWTDNGRSTT